MTFLSPYEPSWRDRAAQWLLGDGRPSPERRRAVEGLLGSTGLGTTGMSVSDLTPVGSVFSGQEAVKDAREGNYVGAGLNALGAVPVGLLSYGAKKALNAAQPVDFLASRTANLYTPPNKSPRPFEADYPRGAPADAAGKLTADMDGRPLTGRYVVGRAEAGGADTPLPASAYDEIAKAGTGSVIFEVPVGPRGNAAPGLGSDMGRAVFDRYTRLPTQVLVRGGLPEGTREKVALHELGHVIDQVAGEIPTNGLSKELAPLYNTLNTGTERARNLMGPQNVGYKGDDVPREFMAEAVRAYMTDPNYIKTVAPKTAARIRQHVNDNPRLKDTVQFNTLAGAAGAGALGAAVFGSSDAEAAQMSNLPPGFVLDEQQNAGLPPGFVLDGAAPPTRAASQPPPEQGGGFWDTAGQYASQLASGMNEGIANMASLPSTAFNLLSNVGPAAWNAATGDNVRPAVVAPDVGAAARSGMEQVGMIRPESDSRGQQFVRRVGQEVGASLVPAMGMTGRAVGAAANAASPVRTAASTMASAVGSGMGAAAAQQIAPGSMGAEIAGQMIGGIAPMALADRARRAALDRAARDAVPTTQQLKDQAQGMYEDAHRTGATASQRQVEGLAQDLRTIARDEGLISPTGRVSEAYPKAREAINMMTDYSVGPMDTKQMQTARKVLSDAAGSNDPAERRLATMFLKRFDDFTSPLVPQFADAREVYGRAKRGETLDRLQDLAAERAGQFSGSGYENALRTEARGLSRAITKGTERGFSKAEQEAIQRVSQGTPVSNAFRNVGRFAPTGPVSLMATVSGPSIAGVGAGNPVTGLALGAIGAGGSYASRKIAEGMGKRAFDDASLLIRNGRPIRQMGLLDYYRPAQPALGLLAGQAANLTNR